MYGNSAAGISFSPVTVSGTAASQPVKTEVKEGQEYPGYITRTHRAILSIAAVLAGVSHKFTLNRKWSLQEELLAGIARTWLGKATEKGIKPSPGDPGHAAIFYQESEKSAATGYSVLLKAGGAFRLNDAVEFFISADYWFIHSSLTRSGMTTVGSNMVLPDVYSFSNSQSVSAMSYSRKGTMKNPSTIDILTGIRVSLPHR